MKIVSDGPVKLVIWFDDKPPKIIDNDTNNLFNFWIVKEENNRLCGLGCQTQECVIMNEIEVTKHISKAV